ncbi:hypothetical protein PAEPH01_0967 [Pancytospora epiphaga]|nr:hypothetical protein PAEPH01_0967 [Pancytospora epiphaga]
MIRINEPRERVYAALLFLLTKENILRDVSKTPFWARHNKDVGEILSGRRHYFRYIEEFFMSNVGAETKSNEFKIRSTYTYLKKIHACLSVIIEKTDGICRERYLCQRFFFHPRFKKFNENSMYSYVSGLQAICMLSTEEDYTQFARDIILNDYYYELTTCEKHKFILELVDLARMKLSPGVAEAFENKVAIYREREKVILGHCSLQ